MRTAEQRPEPPDERRLDLQARLADICRSDPAHYALLVRQHDQLRAAGHDADAAWRTTLGD